MKILSKTCSKHQKKKNPFKCVFLRNEANRSGNMCQSEIGSINFFQKRAILSLSCCCRIQHYLQMWKVAILYLSAKDKLLSPFCGAHDTLLVLFTRLRSVQCPPLSNFGLAGNRFLKLVYMSVDMEIGALNARQKERTMYVVAFLTLCKRQLFGIIIFVPEVKM